MDDAPQALLELGRALMREGYHFVTPTPETHRRVLARGDAASNLRDVFGWSRVFKRAQLPAEWFALLQAADALDQLGDGYRARVRFSSLEGGLYVHSAYPTSAVDAVFFGPDTYRFCTFVRRAAPSSRHVVDIGCGSGAGGLIAARAAGAQRLVLSDINARALFYARINAALSRGLEPDAFALETPISNVLHDVAGPLDLIVANPPYMRDGAARAYRDGGGQFGEALSVRIVREALARLAPGGTLLLYTGVAVVDGRDVFLEAIEGLLQGHTSHYEEVDPDVFGEELERPGYERVERIAAVGLTVRRHA